MIEKTLISIVYASYKEIQHMNFFPISKETMAKIKQCKSFMIQGEKAKNIPLDV